VLVEAMLSGRIAIVTNVAGNAEVTDDNETAFVAGAPTEEAFDEAMERAWLRRAEWQEIGARAAARIRTLVPEDPAADFADALLRLAAGASLDMGQVRSSPVTGTATWGLSGMGDGAVAACGTSPDPSLDQAKSQARR
jgi:hypothetical protein